MQQMNEWNESQAAAAGVEVSVTWWGDISFVNVALIHGRQDVFGGLYSVSCIGYLDKDTGL